VPALLLEELPVRDLDFNAEPTAADLAAIVSEEPLLNAEFEWLLAEMALLTAIERGRVDELDTRRVRRAERAVIRETFAHMARITRSLSPLRAA
jgi:phosphotransacetylase